MVEISEEDFGTLAICAERYALGRRTYMPGLVCEIIKSNLPKMSKKDICILINDIKNPLFPNDYGDECDKADWMRLLKALREHENEKSET